MVRALGLQRLWWRFARVPRATGWTELAALAFGLARARGHLALSSFAPRIAFFGRAWADERLALKLARLTAFALAIGGVVPCGRDRVLTLRAKSRPHGGSSMEARAPAPAERPQAHKARSTLDILGGAALCLGAAIGLRAGLLLQPAPAELGFTVTANGSAGAFQWFRPENKLA